MILSASALTSRIILADLGSTCNVLPFTGYLTSPDDWDQYFTVWIIQILVATTDQFVVEQDNGNFAHSLQIIQITRSLRTVVMDLSQKQLAEDTCLRTSLLVTVIMRAGVPTHLNSRASPRTRACNILYSHFLNSSTPACSLCRDSLQRYRFHPANSTSTFQFKKRSNHDCRQAFWNTHKLFTIIGTIIPNTSWISTALPMYKIVAPEQF